MLTGCIGAGASTKCSVVVQALLPGGHLRQVNSGYTSLLIAISQVVEDMSSDSSALHVLKGLGLSGLAACIAETITLPLDTAKVRFGKH